MKSQFHTSIPSQSLSENGREALHLLAQCVRNCGGIFPVYFHKNCKPTLTFYQYTARRYNLNLKMVMWEPDADPGEQEWRHLQEMLKDHPAKWMIWEGEPLPESAQRLKGLSIEGQIFSPCFARPEHGDFLSVMQQNIRNIENIFNR